MSVGQIPKNEGNKKRRAFGTRTKLGRQSVKSDEGTTKYTPFEDYTELASMVRFQLADREVGAYLLMKGSNRFRFVFAFECQGIQPILRSEQIDPTFDNIMAGLKELPPKERLTFHLSSYTSDKSRQKQLDSMINRTSQSELQFLLMGEKARVEELTRQGLRKPKRLIAYVTYTVESSKQGAQGWVEEILSQLESWLQALQSARQEVEQEKLQEIFTRAFHDGFSVWEHLLSTTMGLNVRPLKDDELWSLVWGRLNESEAVPVPQRITVHPKKMSEDISSPVHATTHLLRDGAPKFLRDIVQIPAKNQQIGILSFEEKPGGWANKYSQMRYLWELLARDRVANTEIFCQFSRANEQLVTTSVQRLLKQSNNTATYAANKNSIDVKASLNTRKTIAAQEEIFEGAAPVHTAVVFVVHRKTRRNLESACRYIQSCFQRPAWVMRETEYAWKIWLQTLPISWDNLMTSPFNRRKLYLSSEAPGLVPLVCTRSGDSNGIELISQEGGTPVHLSFYPTHRNAMIYGTTRSGKSVLLGEIITHALTEALPVVVMDYPKPDGTSTFTDYTRFVNGAYFDISTSSNNLFELPDLRRLSEEVQKERFDDYKDFLLSALMMMVIGTRSNAQADPLLSKTIRSVLLLALNAFFLDPTIQSRYERAIAAGFGTPEWSKVPTLGDFMTFCSPEHLDLESLTGQDLNTAINRITLQLKYWRNSRVGNAISKPSSFPTDSQLLVFALRNLSDDEDAAILSLSAYSAALRRALSSHASLFIIDESPILFEFAEIASLIGKLCANGAKSGIRVVISAQDPDTIAKSPGASKIFQNTNTRLIGRLQPSAVSSFEKLFAYPREIISPNSTEQFFPDRSGIYSNWLLDDNGAFTPCRYYAPYLLLSAVANNPDEQISRTQFLSDYPDKFEAIARFSQHLVSSIRDGA